jgi:glycine cleavage system H protein
MKEIFGFDFRPELYYIEHVWAKVESDGTVKIGLDDIVGKAAHEIFFMKVSSEGTLVTQKNKLGVFESRKYSGPIISPVSGEIIKANEDLRKIGPTIVMEEPYDKGWLCIIKPSNLETELKNLMYGDKAVEWFTKEAEPLQDEPQYFKDIHRKDE